MFVHKGWFLLTQFCSAFVLFAIISNFIGVVSRAEHYKGQRSSMARILAIIPADIITDKK